MPPKPAPIQYHHINQGHAGWFDLSIAPTAAGTDGATTCVGFYFETVHTANGHRGCVIGHIDSDAHKLVPNNPQDARFQAIVADTQNVKWTHLVPAGHTPVAGSLYYTGKADPGLAHAIATGFHNRIGGAAGVYNKDAEGLGARHDAQGLRVTWFIGKSDVDYGFQPVKTDGSLAWTNAF